MIITEITGFQFVYYLLLEERYEDLSQGAHFHMSGQQAVAYNTGGHVGDNVRGGKY